MPSASLAIVQILLAKHLLKHKPPYPTKIPAQNAAETVTLLSLFFDNLILWHNQFSLLQQIQVAYLHFHGLSKDTVLPSSVVFDYSRFPIYHSLNL